MLHDSKHSGARPGRGVSSNKRRFWPLSSSCKPETLYRLPPPPTSRLSFKDHGTRPSVHPSGWTPNCVSRSLSVADCAASRVTPPPLDRNNRRRMTQALLKTHHDLRALTESFVITKRTSLYLLRQETKSSARPGCLFRYVGSSLTGSSKAEMNRRDRTRHCTSCWPRNLIE